MASVCSVLFLLMVAVASLAASRRLQGSASKRCIEFRQDGLSLLATLSLRMFECTAPLFEAVTSANTTQDYRLAVDDFCNEIEHRTCVASLSLKAKHCLKTRDLVEFRVNQDNLHMIIGEVCLRRGVRVAALFQGVVNHRVTGGVYHLWQVCYLNLEHLIGETNQTGDSIAKYKFLKHFRGCVATLGSGQTYLVNAAIDLLNKIIEKFKCVNPMNKKKEVYCYVLQRDYLLQRLLEI